ncbi:MAG TPA: hypothetical protein VJ779_00700 [Acetobacteraceae bacterium]|nr:hypothetical protein [Acetobacteraceae bacterium]
MSRAVLPCADLRAALPGVRELARSPSAPPYSELPPRALLRYALAAQALGLFLLTCHILLVKESIWLFPLALAALAWLYANAPLAGLAAYFQILLYQNLLISIFSPGMTYSPNFVALQGTNFIALAVMAVIAANRLLTPTWRGRVGGVVLTVLIALAATAFYTLIGAAKEGLTSAMVYFREFTSPAFAILVGLDVGRRWGYRTVGLCLLIGAALAIVVGVIEYCVPIEYYSLTNAVAFMQLKWSAQPQGNTFYVPEDIVKHYTGAFFNVTGASTGVGSLTSFRFGGPIENPISYAYVLAVIGLVGVSLRRSGWLLAVLPLLILIGVKGALLLVAFSFVLWVIWQAGRSKPLLVASGVALAVAYTGYGIVTGLSSNDFHVIGFLGGVHGLLANPIGHGIGVGGNLSANANAGFKWTGEGGFTSAGADFAVESAVGVLIYQMGLASIAVFAMFVALLRAAPIGLAVIRNGRARMTTRRQDVLFLAMAMVVVNGIFQEEAYAPYAAGLLALLCGIVIANGTRPSLIRSPVSRRLA